MATNTKKAPATKAKATTTKVEKPVKIETTTEKVEQPIKIETTADPEPTAWVASEHMSDRVPIRSAVYGTLIYTDSLSRRTWIWNEFGLRHELTIETLENARNSQPAFFINGWWEIDSAYEHRQELLEFLDAAKFYQADVSIDNFDTLLKKPATEITAVVKKLPVAQKVQLSRRAQELINEGRLDSMSAIRALEKALNVEFEF